MWRLIPVVMMFAVPACAESWQVLSADQIAAALVSRTLGYPGGATQGFLADGATRYDTGDVSYGHWRVQGDQYCSNWSPSDRWDCYTLAVDARGLKLRFTAKDGSATLGRYIDLR